MAHLVFVILSLILLCDGQNVSNAYVCTDEICFERPARTFDAGGYCNEAGDLCICNYAWQGPNCTIPLSSVGNPVVGFITIGLGAVGLSIIAVVSLVEICLFLYRNWPIKPIKKHIFPIVTYCLCFITSFVRIFYYWPDPWSWNGTRNICGIYSIGE